MTVVKDIEVRHDSEHDDELDLAVGVALPVGFRLQATDQRLTVTSRARSRTLPYLGVFSTLSTGTVGYYAWLILGQRLDIGALIFFSIVGAFALLPVYFLAAGLLNRNDVVIDGDGVRSRSGPLPLPGRADIDRDLIEGLAVEDDGFYTVARTRVDGWKVVAKVRGRFAPVVLLRGLPKRAQADAVVGHIAKYLQLPEGADATQAPMASTQAAGASSDG